MTHPALHRLLAVALALLVGGCAAPTSVNVSTYEPVFRIKDDRVVPEFRAVSTTASISIEDGERVGNLYNITNNSNALVLVSRPAASPTQDALVYFEQKGDTSSIYRQSLSSQAKTTVSSERGLNMTPAFTPDGRYLVFSSDRSGEGQNLWRKRADGAGGVTQVTTSSAFDISPSVAADGETIVFQSHRLNNLEPSVWSVNMNGGLLTQLSDGMSPRVSPDGRRVAFVKQDSNSGRKQVWLMQIDGSGLTQLSDGSADDITPSWHPNGRYIVFASNASTTERGQPHFDIYLMRADGTERTRLTTNESHDDTPVFDRRGRSVIFRSNRGGSWNIYSFSPQL
jgi:TolB protein